MNKLILGFISLCLLTACQTTPRMVFQSIAQGQLDKAVIQTANLVNYNHDMNAKDFDKVLNMLSSNKHFELDHADELVERVKTEPRRAVMSWYIKVYLEAAEAAAARGEFDKARAIWKRNQKMRQQVFPVFEESTPVLGMIDLREAAFRLKKGQKEHAQILFSSAQKKLSRKKPFDQVRQYTLQQVIADLKKRLK